MQKRKERLVKKIIKENKGQKYQQIGGMIHASMIQGREFHRNMLREMAASIATGMASGNTHQKLSPEMIAEDSIKISKEICRLLNYDNLDDRAFETETVSLLLGDKKK